jgi:hypothetical protein
MRQGAQKQKKELTRKQQQIKKRITVAVVCIAVSVVLFVALLIVQTSVLNQAEKFRIFLARQEIVVGTRIDNSNFNTFFMEEFVEENQMIEGAIRDQAEVDGMITSRGVIRGQMLSTFDFRATSAKILELIKDPVKIGFSVGDSITSVVGEIRAGDIINLYGRYSYQDELFGNTTVVTELIAENVYIYDSYAGTDLLSKYITNTDENGNVAQASIDGNQATTFTIIVPRDYVKEFYNKISTANLIMSKVLNVEEASLNLFGTGESWGGAKVVEDDILFVNCINVVDGILTGDSDQLSLELAFEGATESKDMAVPAKKANLTIDAVMRINGTIIGRNKTTMQWDTLGEDWSIMSREDAINMFQERIKKVDPNGVVTVEYHDIPYYNQDEIWIKEYDEEGNLIEEFTEEGILEDLGLESISIGNMEAVKAALDDKYFTSNIPVGTIKTNRPLYDICIDLGGKRYLRKWADGSWISGDLEALEVEETEIDSESPEAIEEGNNTGTEAIEEGNNTGTEVIEEDNNTETQSDESVEATGETESTEG